jgi:hypothetical protein
MSKIDTLVQDLLASSTFARWFVPFLGVGNPGLMWHSSARSACVYPDFGSLLKDSST